MAIPTIDEVQFPQSIAIGALGGPEYKTDIVQSSGGNETRNQIWSAPLYRFNVATGLKTDNDLLTLLAFFRLRRGRLRGFRFRDWSDFQSGQPSLPAGPQSIDIGDGTTTAFQIIKAYADGLRTEYRTITKPVNDATFKVYLNSVLQTSGYTLAPTTGIITFTVPPANDIDISCSFTFDIPCRFDTDLMQATKNEASGFWDNVIIVELR